MYFLSLNLVDQVVEFDKSSSESMAKVKVLLQNKSYKRIICPHESFRSARLVSQLKAPIKLDLEIGGTGGYLIID